MSPEQPFQGDTIQTLESLVSQTTGKTPSPNIQVELTDASKFHCFKLTFLVAAGEGTAVTDASGELQQRTPLELYLHTTQAIDLFSKLATQLAAYMNQASAELLEMKRRELAGVK